MCQEVGHTFGLDHQDTDFANLNKGTCMDYTNDPSGLKGTNGTLSNDHPDQHDYDELVAIYAHTTDGTTTAASSVSPSPASASDLNRQDAWGTGIRLDSKGRAIVYERDFGHGEKLVTFVIWAD